MARTEYTDRELRQGRRLLKEILPRTKAKVMKMRREEPGKLSLAPKSHQGSSLMSRLRQENLEALVIYQRNGGRWYADLLLKKMPVGAPNVMGTPVSDPLSSEKEAREAGQGLLEGILNACLDNELAKSDKVATDDLVFDFPSTALNVPSQVVEEISSAFNAIPEGMGPTLEIMRAQLRTRLLEFFGAEDMTSEDWESLSADRKTVLMANVTAMLALGEFRYVSETLPAPEETDTPEDEDCPESGRFDA